ncbi:hypothetical protein ILUMI_21084 [Ignelater luminosus]|uniref:Uncharacterized protein n=1 Tax=Ignelater luminosus TaxID=2038154 RepID=A0A8K0CG88_IGNLU|nr:hypothetical protein ILUMI_21084 [Ignelater luminosus]
MSDGVEYILSTCNEALQTSVFLTDSTPDSGNILKTYKNGGVAVNNTLQQIGDDFILIAEQKKPLLHMWPINNEQPTKNVKLILPEPASVLAVSPNNHYLAAGIVSKLYIWHLPSGRLLSVQQKHVLPITCIKFSENNGFLVTACQTGMLVTYRFGELISGNNSHLAQSEIGQVEPLYILKDHSAAIVGLHIGNFEIESRLVTISNDHTCRLYNLITGNCLLQIIHQEQLASVIFDTPCWNLFIGTNSGAIYQYNLQNPPRTMSVHADMEENCKLKFEGHERRITCLDLNITNEILVSGSDDYSVIVWNISSRQQLNKIVHRGAITNVKFLTNNKNLFVHNFIPKFKVQSLKRNIESQLWNCEISIVEEGDDRDEDCEFVFEEAEIGKLQQHLYNTKVINKQLYSALLTLNENRN